MTPRRILIIAFFILLALYIIFQARFLIIGPYIRIDKPKDGQVLETELVMINGVAKNVAWLSMNGKQIFTDEKGVWSEKLVLAPGPSIITFVAQDRFGRSREKRILIVVKDNKQTDENEEKELTATSTERK